MFSLVEIICGLYFLGVCCSSVPIAKELTTLENIPDDLKTSLDFLRDNHPKAYAGLMTFTLICCSLLWFVGILPFFKTEKKK